jgi:hypothetical protein
MLTTAITTFVTCLVLFVVVAVLVQTEQAKGGRLVLALVRGWLDRKIVLALKRLSDSWHHFSHYVVRLGWYYSIHSLLRTVLAMLVSSYNFLEGMFEKNRVKTKELRLRKKKSLQQTHFSKIADHKADVALTQDEQVQRRKEKLENNH